MAETVYDRPRIIAEVQERFDRAKSTYGTQARPAEVVTTYFTRELGSEPIKAFLKDADPSLGALDTNAAFRAVSDENKPDFLKALGYGISGILYSELMSSVMEPWSTRKFSDRVYHSFLTNAHLERPDIESYLTVPGQDLETTLKTTDSRISLAVREKVTPPLGEIPVKIGYFFESRSNMRELPGINRLLYSWLDTTVVAEVLEGGQNFQAALDAITPRNKPVAKKFI